MRAFRFYSCNALLLSEDGGDMGNKTGALVAVVLVVVAAAALFAIRPQPGGFRAWIAEAGDGDSEWGWALLSSEAQRAYDGDRDAYLADMAAVDWAVLDLGYPADVWSDDGFVRVVAELRSDSTTVPAFLLDRRIVHGVCDGSEPKAIGVFEDRRPLQGSKFGGGGVTGSQARCNAVFGDAGE
jgi:hypothetical protein